MAFARAIVISPKVLLLDEPLSALDAKLREGMREEITNLVRELSITTIYVTHDQVEALTMSDRMFVMNQGEILREGTPLDIYENPLASFVADFIGKANFIEGDYQKEGADAFIRVNDTIVIKSAQPSGDIPAGKTVSAILRPEKISVSPTPDKADADGMNMLKGKLLRTIFLGDSYETHFEIDGGLTLKTPLKQAYPLDTILYLSFNKEEVKILEK